LSRRYDARVRHVVMYSRPGCGLCDEARDVILAARARVPFDFDEVDITGDDALEREYGIRIPVVLIDGNELFETRIDERELRAAIAS
jgi:glutaredoxin